MFVDTSSWPSNPLDAGNVGPGFEQVRGEAVTQGVRGGWFGDPGASSGYVRLWAGHAESTGTDFMNTSRPARAGRSIRGSVAWGLAAPSSPPWLAGRHDPARSDFYRADAHFIIGHSPKGEGLEGGIRG
jgi:hypothetical protein